MSSAALSWSWVVKGSLEKLVEDTEEQFKQKEEDLKKETEKHEETKKQLVEVSQKFEEKSKQLEDETRKLIESRKRLREDFLSQMLLSNGLLPFGV